MIWGLQPWRAMYKSAAKKERRILEGAGSWENYGNQRVQGWILAGTWKGAFLLPLGLCSCGRMWELPLNFLLSVIVLFLTFLCSACTSFFLLSFIIILDTSLIEIPKINIDNGHLCYLLDFILFLHNNCDFLDGIISVPVLSFCIQFFNKIFIGV